MKRSGKLIAINDVYVLEIIQDPLFDVRNDGTIWTRIAPTGKVYVDKTKWREVGYINRTGYKIINYKYKKVLRSRIVYAKYVAGTNNNPKLESDLVINHKDHNRLNDSPENLELITQSANNTHRFAKHKAVRGNAKITFETAKLIREDQKKGLSYTKLAKKHGLKSKGSISDIIKNRIWVKE